MTIIKKSGKKEDFSMEKIQKSLSAASAEAGVAMTEQEIRRITTELSSFIKDREMMTTQQIGVIIIGLLYQGGFLGILEHYANYKK